MAQKIKNIDRIIFLKRFTEELIINFSEHHQLERKIKIEKLRQKFLKPSYYAHEEAFKKIINHKILHPPKYQKPNLQGQGVQESSSPKQNFTAPLGYKPSIQNPVSIQPEPKKNPEKFYLGKLEPLIQDPFIESIECPGPEKNILIKKNNKINLTKIILSREEISEITNNFSKEARIPLVEGILRAAVGNLVISAVTSEFIGSRFIIKKINPLSQSANNFV